MYWRSKCCKFVLLKWLCCFSVLVLHSLWLAWLLILHLLLATTRPCQSSATAAKNTYGTKNDGNGEERERERKRTQLGRCLLTSASSSPSFALLLVLLGTSTSSALWQNIFLYHVNDLIGDSQILDGASSDVAFGHSPEFVSILPNNVIYDLRFVPKTLTTSSRLLSLCSFRL